MFRFHLLTLVLIGRFFCSSVSCANAAGPAAAAGGQAASALAGELVALAKGTGWAGFARVRANEKVDTDDDTIGKYLTFGEHDIDLTVSIADGNAKASVDVVYQTPWTELHPGNPRVGIPGKWVSYEAKFKKKEYSATVKPPANNQFALAGWGIAKEGQIVFGPYLATAGTDPLEQQAPGGGQPQQAPSLEEPPFEESRVWLRRGSSLPSTIEGTADFAATLLLEPDPSSPGRYLISAPTWDNSMSQVVRTQFGYRVSSVDAGRPQLIPDLVDPAVSLPSGFTALFDAGFDFDSAVAVEGVGPFGGNASLAQSVFAAAVQDWIGFEPGNAAASATEDYLVANVRSLDSESFLADASLHVDFSVPASLAALTGESDPAIYAPNWAYWMPLIDAGQATIDDAWAGMEQHLQAAGIAAAQIRYLTVFSSDGAQVVSQVPEPATFSLLSWGSLLSLGLLLFLRRKWFPANSCSP